VKLDLVIVVQLSHIVLLLLVTTEYAYFFHIGIQKAIEHCIPEGAGATGDDNSLVFKHALSL
jgi:hypothetical protein